MNHWISRALNLAMCTTLAVSLAARGEDDDSPAPGAQSTVPALNAEQQRAVGLRVARPVPAKAPERVDALGTVLDRTALVNDDNEVDVAASQEHASSSELARLHQLYQSGAGASLKMLEAAQADDVKARADARLAVLRFAQHWGPLAGQSAEARRKLLDAVASGHSALVRADIPGRHVLGALPAEAVLDLDGMQVPGRVLGALEQPSDLQSAGLLVEVRNPPAGLFPGARIPLTLLSSARAGLLLPKDALLYGEDGAFVYKQVLPKARADKVQYVPVKVTPLVPYGDGWLVKGVDDDDEIVVHGAGVLWSLEGMGAHPVDDDDDD
jgi:hypothetical protein